jgi:NAD+-dependent secondary alcohol dehydrogenase Adh1
VAALADAGLTAYHAVRKAVPLLYPGTTCVVIGAGGLGHIGVQCLLAMTATNVVVVDPNEKARALATELGAQRVVGSADELDEGSAHVVLDFVGERGAEKQGLALTRRAGSYFVIGYGGSIDIPTIDLISTERNIIGNLVGSYNDLDELMTLAAQGKVTLHTKTYPLTAVNEAMDDLEAGRLQGRGILIP